jgi:hypothetical protein
MMLSYDARTQPVKGSVLGQIFHVQKALGPDGPLALKTIKNIRGPEPQTGWPSHFFTQQHHFVLPSRPDGGGRLATCLSPSIYTFARGPSRVRLENSGKFDYDRNFCRGGGVEQSAGGSKCFLARGPHLFFIKIRSSTALFAIPHKHSHTPYGASTALPALCTALNPTSTLPIPTSAPTGLLSQLAQRLKSPRIFLII